MHELWNLWVGIWQAWKSATGSGIGLFDFTILFPGTLLCAVGSAVYLWCTRPSRESWLWLGQEITSRLRI